MNPLARAPLSVSLSLSLSVTFVKVYASAYLLA